MITISQLEDLREDVRREIRLELAHLREADAAAQHLQHARAQLHARIAQTPDARVLAAVTQIIAVFFAQHGWPLPSGEHEPHTLIS